MPWADFGRVLHEAGRWQTRLLHPSEKGQTLSSSAGTNSALPMGDACQGDGDLCHREEPPTDTGIPFFGSQQLLGLWRLGRHFALAGIPSSPHRWRHFGKSCNLMWEASAEKCHMQNFGIQHSEPAPGWGSFLFAFGSLPAIMDWPSSFLSELLL